MKVYIASNGDILMDFEKAALPPEEVALGMAKAQRMLLEGQTESINAEYSDVPLRHIRYSDLSGNFMFDDTFIENSYNGINTVVYMKNAHGETPAHKLGTKIASENF